MKELSDIIGTMAGLGFNQYLWDPEKKERADRMVQEYGDSTAVWLQYVFQGGARDLQEFIAGYDSSINYQKREGWLPEDIDPSEIRKGVKNRMASVSQSTEMKYIFCPFMKSRALNVIQSEIAPKETVEEVMCLMLTGKSLSDYEFTPDEEQKRHDYLVSVGLLDV